MGLGSPVEPDECRMMADLSTSLALSISRTGRGSCDGGTSKLVLRRIGIAMIDVWSATCSITPFSWGDSACTTASHQVSDNRLIIACAESFGDSKTTAKPARSSPKHVAIHSMFVGPNTATLACSFYCLESGVWAKADKKRAAKPTSFNPSPR